ncbi:MAG: lipocalin-like domain-containing protein [Anaerolineae bacterium]
MRLTITIIALLIISGLLIARFDTVNTGGEIQANVDSLLAAPENSQFARADKVIPIAFPADLGQHPQFRTEWWYYTGNLGDTAGERFGFQLTFFRRALLPTAPQRTSEWATNQIYFAHFTLTDVTGNLYQAHERYSRGSPNLAGAQSPPYRVWIDDWSAQEIGPGKVRLQAHEGDYALDLSLEQAKAPVLHGDQGLSQKSKQPGNASYYYSLTDNPAQGTVTTPRGVFAVTGNAWKDHEWSTSDLPPGSMGWEWFSLQLDDGREVMFFSIRRQDGSLEPHPTGTIIYADGRSRTLSHEEVEITTLAKWISSSSGATYPAEWQFAIPAEGIDLHIKPLLPQQELRVSFTYWEGAVSLEGSHTGYGYVELTGYSDSMRGRF